MKTFLVALFIPIVLGQTKIPDADQIEEAYFAIEELIASNERLGAKFLRLGVCQ